MNELWQKLNRRRGRLAITLALLCCLLTGMPRTSLAADPVDSSRLCSLTLICHYASAPLSGMELRLYRVADGTVDKTLTLSGAFAASGVSLNGLDRAGWTSAAATLAGYAQTNSITPTISAKTDANGAAVFASLSQGVYLAVGTSLTIGLHTYYFAPFLVALPNPTDSGGWNYDVTAYPKVTDPTATEIKKFDINVLLQWSDAGLTSRRPSTVGITLYRNGTVYENYTLSAVDNWRHTWPGLDQSYSWSVVQTTALDTYSVSYQSSGNVLVITDVIRAARPVDSGTTGSTGSSTSNGSIPLTGLLWWPVDVLAVIGLLLFTVGWRRRFGGKEKNHAA